MAHQVTPANKQPRLNRFIIQILPAPIRAAPAWPSRPHHLRAVVWGKGGDKMRPHLEPD